MALTYGGIVRTSVIGTYLGQEMVNVFDVHVDILDADLSRDEACFDLAGDILNNWSDHILPLMSDGYTANEVRWVDLNNDTGSTGARSTTSDNTWPEAGGGHTASLPGNVYIKVVKTIQGKNRQQRQGMVRWGAALESRIPTAQPNTVLPAFITTANAAWEDFKDGINGQTLDRNNNLGVLHTVNEVATGFSVISTFQVASVLGTIRRRMPGYGS